MINWNDVLRFANSGNPAPPRKVFRPNEEWKGLLPADVYAVTRLKGTERAHSSELCNLFEPGAYHCICCETQLFDSREKFRSSSGWPSFNQPFTVEAVAYTKDNSHGMTRIEATCNVCDSHLGHVFPDGPPPAGLRFCINALSLRKVQDRQGTTVSESNPEHKT